MDLTFDKISGKFVDDRATPTIIAEEPDGVNLAAADPAWLAWYAETRTAAWQAAQVATEINAIHNYCAAMLYGVRRRATNAADRDARAEAATRRLPPLYEQAARLITDL